jgi:NAD(P)-dependent dehydrogenase (short-subunit alcohol dehydrogenase family)
VLDSRILAANRASEGPYEATKRGLLEYTRKSAMMFAETIRVNAVAPGPVFAPTDVHEAAGETLLGGKPAAIDVAKAVAFLLEAESTTGCIIPVDSGQSLLEP